MFAGLFGQPVSGGNKKTARSSSGPSVKAPSHGQSRALAQTRDTKLASRTTKKKSKQLEFRELPETHNINESPRKGRQKNKRNGSPNVPKGAIPMTEDEIERFQEWLAEQKGRKRKGSTSDLDQFHEGKEEIHPISKSARRKLRKKQLAKSEFGQAHEPKETNLGLKKAKRKLNQTQLGEEKEEHALDPNPPLSKKARKKIKKKEARKHEEQGEHQKLATEMHLEKVSLTSVATPPLQLSNIKASGALGKAAARLQGSRFRYLNETLYTISGSEAKVMYDNDPSLATAYHEGFREQAAKWPKNPLDGIIGWLQREVPADRVIGDFGCGDARLALELKGRKVYSFDLVRINERVTPCNLASVPLGPESLDIAVFCLALMGTDWPAFIEEARRCLRPGGTLHIAEVESRVNDIDAMVSLIGKLGFRKVFSSPGNFFIEMRFTKDRNAKCAGWSEKDARILSECSYKRR